MMQSALAVLIVAQNAVPATAQKALETTGSYSESLTRMLWVLAIMVIVLFAAGRFLPRLLGQRLGLGSRGLIKIIESKPLAPRRTLYLVPVVDQYYLLGVTDQKIDVLAGGDFEPATLAHLSSLADAGGAMSATAPRATPPSKFVERLLETKAAGARQEPPIGGES